MRAGALVRGDRSVGWTGAVVVVLLAALVHLLGCAHGPTPVHAPRADALSSARAASCAQFLPEPPRTAATGHDAPVPDEWCHCRGLDQPAVRTPREGEPTGAGLLTALPTDPAGGSSTLAPAALRPGGPRSTAPSGERARAGLGVWRT
ncbi:hypothetical protein ACF061_24300 [Streptomyces sp. NPDC015220]|uniref:hypothetical protein n=1 Tax=Streptomyces sp. NPDC015220 TaxID=3364947 RepID=UPI003701616A